MEGVRVRRVRGVLCLWRVLNGGVLVLLRSSRVCRLKRRLNLVVLAVSVDWDVDFNPS